MESSKRWRWYDKLDTKLREKGDTSEKDILLLSAVIYNDKGDIL
jgi:hypothetical protein